MNNHSFQFQASPQPFINGPYDPGRAEQQQQQPQLVRQQSQHQAAPPPPQHHQFIQHHQQQQQQQQQPQPMANPFIYDAPQQHPQQLPLSAQAKPQPQFSAATMTQGGVAADQPDAALMQSRIAILLDTNLELIEHAVKAPRDNHHHPESLFLACMKRLQSNLAYLAALADKSKVMSGAAYPTILTAPPEIASLQRNYEQLRALFPESNATSG